MMKAAYKYYQQTATSTEKATNKITLGELNAANRAQVRVSSRQPREKKLQLTREEQALMNLVNSGQIGALIAYHAPAPEAYY